MSLTLFKPTLILNSHQTLQLALVSDCSEKGGAALCDFLSGKLTA
jgi:hypothetical protein